MDGWEVLNYSTAPSVVEKIAGFFSGAGFEEQVFSAHENRWTSGWTIPWVSGRENVSFTPESDSVLSVDGWLCIGHSRQILIPLYPAESVLKYYWIFCDDALEISLYANGTALLNKHRITRLSQ